MIGEVAGGDFRIQKRRYYRNDFAPQFYGELFREPGGTRIEGYFDMSRWVKMFMRIWLGGVVLIGSPIFILSLLDITTGSHNVSGDVWVGVIVPPGMVAFGFLLPRLGRLLGLGEERYILEFLQSHLAARVEHEVGV